MDVNIQNREAPQVEGSWVPNTPLKPVLTTPSVIYTDHQRNQQIPFDWLGSEGSSSLLTPATQIYGTGACVDSTNGDREAAFGVETGTFGACRRFNNVDINGPCVYRPGHFQALLAIAEGGHWIKYTHDCQRFLSEVISPFAPVTPEKKMTPEHKVGTEDETISEERQKQGNEIAILAVDVNRQQTDNEVQNQVNSSCPALIKEHHEPDKGSVHEIDLNKIPQKRSRRKKHRPKVIAEGETKRTPKPTIPKHVGSKENPTVKRKYVRKNGLNKSSRSLPMEVPEDSAETKSSEPPKKSCRRALSFDGNEQRRGEYSKCSQNSQEPERVAECSGGENRSTLHLGSSIEVIVETTQAGVAYDLTLAVNQMLKDYSSLPQKQSPTTQFPVKLDMWGRNQNPNPKENNTQTQARVTGNDLPYTTSQAVLLASTQLTPVSPEGSHVGMTMTEGEQATGSKRKAVHSVEQPGSCSTSQTGIQYSALTAYQSVQFPATCKRKRTEKGQNSTTSSMSSSFGAQDVVKCPQKTLEADPSKLKFSSWISPQPYNNALSNVRVEAGRGHRCNQPAVGCMLSHPERATKKRSRGPTRARDWASLTGFPGSAIHPSYLGRQVLVGFDRQVNSSRPQTCMEALTSQMSDTLTRKKRTKRVSLVNSAVSSTNERQSYGQIILSNQNQFSTKSLGAPEEIWEYLIYLDDISGRLKHLDISSERNALVPYNMMNEKQKALVLYSGDGVIVPIRKRRPRPKVELDDETNKVWKLLMASINSAGINGTDEEKARWWEEERRVFHGRVDSFIARMHLVQGDRRFSQWKGSVLDSVIGVFLTQNVSDHLSSSAFISLAARFPLKSKNKPIPCCRERTSSVIEKPIVIIDPDDTAKWHEGTFNLSACDQSSMTLHETELNEEPEVVNSNGSPGSSTGIVCSETGPEMYYKSMVKTSTIEITETGNGCYIAEEKTQTYDANSSNDSVVSSQTSVGSPSTQSPDIAESTDACDKQRTSPLKTKESDMIEHNCSESRELKEMNAATRKAKSRRVGKEIREDVDWDALRKQAEENGKKREGTADTMDSMNYEAVRCAEVEEIADAIKERGMNNMLAERIKNFLNRLFKEHGSTNLEWLRDVPPEKAKEFLLSIIGLGLKSVECVRLLTLQHLAFPVDTNVGRIAVRLGWVPLQPLPESLQLHLLELYPVQESIQKYLWPRLCKLDQRTLYELHYQLITFGKVFCTKGKPNCNACPMRGECRHFASAFASARLALPGTEEKRLVSAPATKTPDQNPAVMVNQLPLPLPKVTKQSETNQQSVVNRQSEAESGSQNCEPIIEVCSARLALPGTEEKHLVSAPANEKTDQNHEVMGNQLPLPPPKVTKQSETNQQSVENRQSEAESGSQNCEPIIEEPSTPEPEQVQETVHDIEDCFWEDPDEIPTIRLNMEEFTQNLQNYMQQNMEIQEGDLSRALVALTAEAASIPMPRLKNVSRLRTEHQVYGLPDNHPLLQGLERREPDDPSPYLLAIWSPGETAESIQPPERKCSSQEYGKLCNEKTCSYCNSAREVDSKIVRGTLLIPCRTAMRGSFPLNGTYFQVNEVFADYDSSRNPIAVPRSWIWDLPRRTVHFGTSVPTIFRGMTTEEIQHCFWKGFVCVRAFDQKTRAPRPLIPRLHFPASKNKERGKGKKKARAE